MHGGSSFQAPRPRTTAGLAQAVERVSASASSHSLRCKANAGRRAAGRCPGSAGGIGVAALSGFLQNDAPGVNDAYAEEDEIAILPAPGTSALFLVLRVPELARHGAEAARIAATTPALRARYREARSEGEARERDRLRRRALGRRLAESAAALAARARDEGRSIIARHR